AAIKVNAIATYRSVLLGAAGGRAGARVVMEAATEPVSLLDSHGSTLPESGPPSSAGWRLARRRELPRARSERAACRSAPWARFVCESAASPRELLPSHGLRAAITSAGIWYRSAGFLASILATTAESPLGRAESTEASLGALRSWCCRSFWVVFPSNGGLPTRSAKNVAPSE